jgi:hypothetical protein
MSYKILDTSRIQIHPGVSIDDLKVISANEKVSVVQFAEPLSDKEFDNLEKYVFRDRNDIQLRVYGHYSGVCDLSFLLKLPHLKKFSADCLLKATNVDTISSLKNLEELHVGIYHLDCFQFLDEINVNLKRLLLGSTFSKKPSIKSLSRFKSLEFLYLDGQMNGIEAINTLKNLQKIVLRSISTKNLNFLIGLNNLWSVDIKLGGIKDFSALVQLPSLKYLELWQINKLADISYISNLSALQNLFIQSLRNVEALPSFEKNCVLRRVYLENMKGLKDLSSLKTAPVLEEFIYSMAQNQKIENLKPVLENRSVKQVAVGFGSVNKNNLFDELVAKNGKQVYHYHDFKYQ